MSKAKMHSTNSNIRTSITKTIIAAKYFIYMDIDDDDDTTFIFLFLLYTNEDKIIACILFESVMI